MSTLRITGRGVCARPADRAELHLIVRRVEKTCAAASEAAQGAGVSLLTLRQFENGKVCNITMGNFLAMLRMVDCLERMDDVLPGLPVSAYVMEQIMHKKARRVKHGK